MLALPPHAGYFLFASANQLWLRSLPPIFKAHGDPVLRCRAQEHANNHLIESLQLSQVLAGALESNQRKAALKLQKNFRDMFAQKHLSCPSLPAQMADVIDVADQIGLFKPNHVPVFISFH